MECLASLTKLFLDNNRIGFVEGLEGCSRLEELHLSNQEIPQSPGLMFDSTTLAAIAPSLNTLNISNSRLCRLAPVADLDRLTTLKVTALL